MKTSPILVTGASGFVAIHTIIQLLEQGYAVRGTIRSLKKEADLRKTISRYVQANDRLEILPADLEQAAGWEGAMSGVETVLHVASPFPLFEPEKEDDLIIPAVQGTLRVLRAAHKAGVKRVVQVSSVAAISSGHNGENKTFTEADWSDLTKDIGAYAIFLAIVFIYVRYSCCNAFFVGKYLASHRVGKYFYISGFNRGFYQY